MATPEWDGSERIGDCVAIAVLCSKTAQQAPVLVAARADDQQRLIRPEHLGDFVRVHRDAVFVCYDAAATHRVIADHFQRAGDKNALDLLWEYARTARLADVGLLDQLVAQAQQGIERRRRPLEVLAAESHAGPPLDAEVLRAFDAGTDAKTRDDVAQLLKDAAGAIADAVRAVYKALIVEARKVVDEAEVDEGFVDWFGLLALGVQVQGAIALDRPNRLGVRLRKDALGADSALLAECEQVYNLCSHQLYADPAARRCFDWDEDKKVARETTGRVKTKKDKLAGWLQSTLASNPGMHDIPFEPPRSYTKKIALSPHAWDDLVDCHPLLQAWSRLEAAAHLKRALVPLRTGERLNPKYEVLPRITSGGPDLVQLRAFSERTVIPKLDPIPGPAPEGPSTAPGFGVWTLFEPPDGRAILAAELPDLELRCVTEICARRGYGTELAKLFADDIDPVYFAAARIYPAPDRPPESLRDFVETLFFYDPKADPERADKTARFPHFEALRAKDPVRFQGYLMIARAILRAAPRGLAPEQVRNLLPPELDLFARSLKQAYNLVTFLGLHELSVLVADDALSVLQIKLGCEYDEDIDWLMDRLRPGQTGQILRRMISGTAPRPDFAKRLREACRVDGWKKRLAVQGSPELYHELFAQTAMTGVGRVRGGMYFNQATSADFLDLADDVRKVALFAVVRAGYELLGVAGDQFAVYTRGTSSEVSARDEADHIRALVVSAASEVLDHVPVVCRVGPLGA